MFDEHGARVHRCKMRFLSTDSVNGVRRVSRFFARPIRVQDDKIVMDLSGCEGLDAGSILIAYLAILRFPQSKVEFYDSKNGVVMKLLQHIRHLFSKGRTGDALSDEFYLRAIRDRTKMVSQLTTWAAGVKQRANADAEACAKWEMFISELVQNCFDHSMVGVPDRGGPRSFVVGRADREKGVVQLAAADQGLGIPTNVRRLEAIDSDGRCILRALDRGFTSASTRDNQGSGLANIVNELGHLARSSLYIASRDGIASVTRGRRYSSDLSPLRVCGASEPNFPGTITILNLPIRAAV